MKIKIYSQKVYSLIIAYMLSFSALLNLCNGLLNTMGLQTVLDTVVLYCIMYGLLIFGLFIVFYHSENMKVDVFLLVGFLASCYLISMIVFPQNRQYLFTEWADYAKNPLYVIFLYSVSGYIFARRLEDYDYFKSVMQGFSYTVVIMSVPVFFFAKDSSARQYMTFSYNMLTHLFFLILNKPKRLKILHYITVFLGIFVFAFGGARGALLSLLIAGVWLYVTTGKTKKKIIIGLLAVFAGIVVIFMRNEMFLLLEALLEKLSIDSRSFSYVINGEFWDDSNRFGILLNGKDAIGLFGKGLMGDRSAVGSYMHNIIMEFLVQYGAIFGTLLVVALLVCIGRALSAKNTAEYRWIIILLPCGFLKLMFTGSYLNLEPAFYIFLGFCVNALMRSGRNADTVYKYRVRRGKYGKDR